MRHDYESIVLATLHSPAPSPPPPPSVVGSGDISYQGKHGWDGKGSQSELGNARDPIDNCRCSGLALFIALLSPYELYVSRYLQYSTLSGFARPLVQYSTFSGVAPPSSSCFAHPFTCIVL